MENGIASGISVIGKGIIIIGIIGSLIAGMVFPTKTNSYTETYNWIFMIVGILSSVITGFIFLGFAEIIELLQKNLDQSKILENILIKTNEEKQKTHVKQIDELPEL